jgi:hypothetical protein
MGFFGWINKQIKKFTGQATFEEADQRYEDIIKRFNEHKAYFDSETDKCIQKIEKHVDNINEAKKRIKTELFPVFAEKIKQLADVSISDVIIKEQYEGQSVDFEQVKNRSDLFLIDFKKNPFKTNVLAIVTLGFATRKRAKETLLKVKEEEERINEVIERMNSELARINRIEESLGNIEHYFDSLIDVYNALLNRLDHSINFLLFRCLNLLHTIVRAEMSIKHLPKRQQKEIEAIVTISKIMKQMVDTQIIVDESVSSSEVEAKKDFSAINEMYNAA